MTTDGSDPGYDLLHKMLLVGNSGAGKTSLLARFTSDDAWRPFSPATIGIDFKIRIAVVDGSRVKFQLWDTAGAERFRTIITAYYRGAAGILFVYDITSSESFDSIVRWHKDFEAHGTDNTKKIIVGMKVDMTTSRTVTKEQGASLARSLGARFMEVSAKTGEGVEQAFFTLARDINGDLPDVQKDTERAYSHHPAVMQNFISQMEGRDVVDIKIFAFSRLYRHDDVVGAKDPLPVFSSAGLIESRCDYFKTMLKYSSFKEGTLVPLDTLPVDEEIDRYDYSSDSDLGDEDSDDLLDDIGKTMDKVTTRFSCAWDNIKLAVADLQGTAAQEPGIAASRDCLRMGRVIHVKDVAYVTMWAFVFYLYTSQITFAPLYGRRKVRAGSRTTTMESPSARSVYRLADKLGVKDLGDLAKAHISSQLTKQKILEELFRPFTSRYPAILEMELAFFKKHKESLKQSQAWVNTVRAISRGEMLHVPEAILLNIMTM